jgi:hypothetical protein
MHPNPDTRRACRGTSLVEMLMFIAVFSMAIVMLSKIFVTTSRMSVYSTQIVDRMNAVREVQRDFTETVREAVAVVPGIGEHRTDDKTLVLQLHHAGAPERYAVLGMLDGQPRLCFMEVTGTGEALQADKYVMWRLPVAAAHFEVDAAAQRVTLTLDTQPHNPQKPASGRTHRFVAALRTDAVKEMRHEQ